MAITCVTIIALVGMFIVAMFDLDGNTLVIIVGASIAAVAGLGGYEIREQLKQSART